MATSGETRAERRTSECGRRRSTPTPAAGSRGQCPDGAGARGRVPTAVTVLATTAGHRPVSHAFAVAVVRELPTQLPDIGAGSAW
jgi:hypothetical protein